MRITKSKLLLVIVFEMMMQGGFGLPFLTSTYAEQADRKEKKPPAESHSDSQWRAKMQSLRETLTRLVTYTSSNTQFNLDSNKKKIEADAKKLASLAHDLTKNKMAKPDLDPSISLFSQQFSEEAQQAYHALKTGHREYARGILKSISGYCITCHTRSNSGPQFMTLTLTPGTEKLSTLELGEFYAATRQYDMALQEFQKLISDSSAAARLPLDWERAVRYSLAISVRVKKDPTLSLNIVNQVIDSKNSPYFLKQDASQWKDSLLEWQKEGVRKAQTEEGYRAEVLRLLAQAHQIQKYPVDRSAEVVYLRASSAIHEWMQYAPNGKYLEEAYLFAGVCYEVLRTLNLGELHEMYYEACIKKAPHTETAKACYRRYEQSIYQGFTGSNGTHIPSDVKLKLQALEESAQPLKPIQN